MRFNLHVFIRCSRHLQGICKAFETLRAWLHHPPDVRTSQKSSKTFGKAPEILLLPQVVVRDELRRGGH